MCHEPLSSREKKIDNRASNRNLDANLVPQTLPVAVLDGRFITFDLNIKALIYQVKGICSHGWMRKCFSTMTVVPSSSCDVNRCSRTIRINPSNTAHTLFEIEANVMMLHVVMPLLHTHPVTNEKFLLKVDGSWIGRKVLVYLRFKIKIPTHFSADIFRTTQRLCVFRSCEKRILYLTTTMGCESSVEVLNVPLIAQTQRVIAIDPNFCKSRVVTLQVQRHFLSSTTTIRDLTTGTDVFGIKSSSFSSRKTLLNHDKSPIVNYKIKTAFFSHKPTYRVYAGNTQSMNLFEIYAKYDRRDRTELRVEITDAFTDQHYSFDLKGDWHHRHAFIWLERNRSGVREPVARVHCPQGVARNDYHLDVAPNVDIALMVMICDALAMEESRVENSRSSSIGGAADAHSIAVNHATCTSATAGCAM